MSGNNSNVSWWLSEFKSDQRDCFKGIDFESFLNLQPNHIREAFPNLVQRIQFETAYNKFLKTVNIGVVDLDQNLDLDVNLEPPNTIHEIACISDDITPTRKSDETNCVLVDNSISEIVNIFDNVPLKRNEIKTPQDILAIPSIELKIVIKKYDVDLPLDDYDRNIIGKAVIHYLLVTDLQRVIERKEFLELANVIVGLFPKETRGCYYTPSHKNLQAQGKLHTAYNSYKLKLREHKLIPKRARAATKSVSQKLLPQPKSIDNSELHATALLFICEESDDFEKIKLNWVDSHSQRISELLPKLSTSDYINKFPAFDLARGYELLCLDASQIYGDITSKFPEISKKILVFASRQKKPSLDVSMILKEFDDKNNLDQETFAVYQQLIAIKLLPHLIKGSYKRKRKTEAAIVFCNTFKTLAEAEEHNKKAALVPCINFIGESLIPICQIVIANKTFIIENPITGFEVLFKIFLALAVKYPDEFKHIWFFIQKAVYGISTKNDVRLSNVETFIQDISNIIIEK